MSWYDARIEKSESDYLGAKPKGNAHSNKHLVVTRILLHRQTPIHSPRESLLVIPYPGRRLLQKCSRALQGGEVGDRIDTQ
jgi:hypothetical protein